MANIGKGIQGLGQGASAGAALGSIIPGLGTGLGAIGGGLLGGLAGLFGGGDSYSEERAALYDKLMQQYVADPNYAREQQALDDLRARSQQTGLTDYEKANLYEARRTADDYAHGAEGAVRDRMVAQGGGRSNLALQALLEQQAGQAASGRLAQSATSAAGHSSAQRDAALRAYQEGAARSLQAAGAYRLAASGQATAAAANNAERGDTYGSILRGVNDLAGAAALAYNDYQRTPRTNDAWTGNYSQQYGVQSPLPAGWQRDFQIKDSSYLPNYTPQPTEPQTDNRRPPRGSTFSPPAGTYGGY